VPLTPPFLSEDITTVFDRPLLVVGFFTPDYRPLATLLAINLTELKISHHLYARAKEAGQWGHQTLQKPSVLKQARNEYPHHILLFMDVDCQVRGDISAILNSVSDITMPIGRKPMKNGTALKPGTRVLMIKPTRQSDLFLDLWEEKCRMTITPVENDEIRLQMAIEDSKGQFSIASLPRQFSGIELRKASSEDVIIHDSARDNTRFLGALRKKLKHLFRNIRNNFYHRLTSSNDLPRKRF